MKNSIILLIIVIITTLAAGLFVYPLFPAPFNFLAEYSPWRLGLDLIGGTHLIYEADLSSVDGGDRDSVMEGLRDVMERRVNMFGVSEPQVAIAKEGGFYRLVIELAGIKDPREAINQIGRTAFLEFRETAEIPLEENSAAENKEARVAYISTGLSGRYLIKAEAVRGESLNQPQIALTFNAEGAKMFEEITGRNVGKQLAIFIDNEPISAPRVNEKIIGGKAVITGVTLEEAKNLANLLNAGALPAPINLVSQQLIGPNLGEESLKKAIFAGVIGVLAVMAFMVVYYRLFGVFASLALLIYTVLTLAIFKLTSMTMTLSGIAGFILSIGMAVDANILIFERTKEEVRKGVSKVSAIEEGFRRAWSSIRDSNISTIITAVILYKFTSSFVQGFALTLLIGVLISMFSAITITRTMLKVFIKK